LAEEEINMSKQEFSIAYNGDDREDDHTIDVETLGPALVAFGRLIREANTEFNGKSATARVMVVSDFEHKCFNINFEVILNLVEQAKSLIGTQSAVDAKEILEWIGIIGGPPMTAFGFLKFLRWRKGRKIETVTRIEDKSQKGIVNVTIVGDGNTVNVTENVMNLAKNRRALKATRDAFAPVGQEGFDRIEFKKGDETIDTFKMDAADEIIASCNVGIEESHDFEPDMDVTSAWLTVHGPVYDAKSKNWRFKLGKDVIIANITETSIAQDALARGGAFVEDSYYVRLEITTPADSEGRKMKPAYKILEVLRFVPANPTSQTTFIDLLDGGTERDD